MFAKVEKHRQLMLDALDYIWKNPETGYKEWKTNAYLTEKFEKLGYRLTQAGNIPGFTALLDTGRPGPTVAVFGELDGLVIPEHPDADPETGAVHACGHCAQASALLGLAAALKEPGALDDLSGKILLVAVPAEELIEFDFRLELRSKGIIKYLGGKPEFLYRGLLDGVDLAFMVHTKSGDPHIAGTLSGSNGMIAKTIEFQGVSAHAGGSPHLGINALYAANTAMTAINALRETFKDSDHIRVHPIITFGGASVNAIPDKICMESYIRGATMDAIVDANRKVNRAVAGCAAAFGAKAVINDFPGYWPRNYSDVYLQVIADAAESAGLQYDYKPGSWGTGCSDMGDICAVMPGVHPTIGGASGTSHGSDYVIADPESTCVDSAKLQYAMLRLLLENDAIRAKQVVAETKTEFGCKEDYFAYVDKLDMSKQTVCYQDDGTVLLDYKN